MSDETTSADPFAETVDDDTLEEQPALSGYNPSEGEDAPDPLLGEADSLLGEDATPVTTSAVPDVVEDDVPDVVEDDDDENEIEVRPKAKKGSASNPMPVEPEPEPEKATGKPERSYLVLAEKDGTFAVVGTAAARSSEAALRKVYREIVEEEGEFPEMTLVAVAKRMWKPTTVTARPSTRLAIDLG